MVYLGARHFHDCYLYLVSLIKAVKTVVFGKNIIITVEDNQFFLKQAYISVVLNSLHQG